MTAPIIKAAVSMVFAIMTGNIRNRSMQGSDISSEVRRYFEKLTGRSAAQSPLLPFTAA